MYSKGFYAILMGIFFCFGPALSGQPQSDNLNGGFEVYTGSCGDCGSFSKDCLFGWTPSHGTPVVVDWEPEAANCGTNFIRMFDRQDEGEGLLSVPSAINPTIPGASSQDNVQFIAGRVYVVCLRVRVFFKIMNDRTAEGQPVDGDVRIFAVRGLNGSLPNGRCSMSLPNPPNKQSIISLPFSTQGLHFESPEGLNTQFTQSDWYNITVEFRPQEDYERIWIYPDVDLPPPAAGAQPDPREAILDVDNVSIVEGGESSLTFPQPGITIPSANNWAVGMISAGTGGAGETLTDPAAITSLVSGNQVILQPGFKAEAGSNTACFLADINPEIHEPFCAIFCDGEFDRRGEESQESKVGSELSLVVSPNPLKSKGSISYHLPVSGAVSIRMYNQMGQLVEEVANKNQSAGDHELI
ncbi:MAG: hypothetical protein AAF206_27185, partial [Bacteroidota bacterium]